MTLTELCLALRVKSFPPELEAYYPVPAERKGELCSEALLSRLEKDYALFGDYYGAVSEGLRDLENDPNRRAYLDSVSLFIKDQPEEECRKLHYPPAEESPASRMMPLLAHLPAVDGSYEAMRRRGLTHEEVVHHLSAYRIYLWESEHSRTGWVGIPANISRWMIRFTKGSLFLPMGCGLNFGPRKLLVGSSPYFLRHRKTGEVMPLFGDGILFHRSGLILGSAGATEEEGSFAALYEETEEAYVGNPTRLGLVSQNRERFPKADWQLFAAPGDVVLTTHIFIGTDLTPERVTETLREAKRIAKECYPEYDFKGIGSTTWLFNPLLGRLLGDTSKLARFAGRFTRFPAKSAAKSWFAYVFPGCDPDGPIEALPDKTSLQRKLKTEMEKGIGVHEFSGLFPMSEI